jgi:isoquinoline 1-oxidoreductase beta subunit
MDMNRRNFLKLASATGVGATFGFSLQSCSSANAELESKNKNAFSNAWVHIPESGKIEFTSPRSEMGQGASTGLAVLLCEAMDYPLDELEVKNAAPDKVYNHKQYGLQTTGGSTSISTEWEWILEVGASIRATLMSVAAKKYGVSVSEVKTKDGHVLVSGKSIPYQELSKLAAKSSVVSAKHKVDLKNLKNNKYIGKNVRRVDNTAKVTGKEQYGIDGGIPNALAAVIVPFPKFGATPISCNEKDLLKFPGVKHILKISTGFAIVAEKYWQAIKAKEEFQGKWKDPKTPFSTSAYHKACQAKTKDYGGDELLDKGPNYKKLDNEIEVEYSVPYLAHATLEPQNATVWVKKDSAEVWLPTQSPGAVKPFVNEIANIPHENIKVNCSSLGGGFGRRGEMDALRNATEISAQIKKPVKLIYSREDDMKYGYYRPYVYSRLKASFDKDAKDIYWKQSIATQSIAEEVIPKMMPSILPSWMGSSVPKSIGKFSLLFTDGMTVKEGILAPYNLKGANVNWAKMQSPVTTLFWRSVGHTQNGFFVESFVDEIADKAGIDPMTFRESRLDKGSRQLKVLQKVKEMSGWAKKNGKNMGVATHFSFKSYAAAVIEVDTSDDLKVKNVWMAIDCGAVINPDGVYAQLMSAAVFGLTATLFGKIDIENGEVQQENFGDYQLLTMEQTPNIYTEIVESSEAPTGAGEPGVPVIAPALCNAIFRSNKKRIRNLPVSDHMEIS